jgi:hypothetical protein
MGTCFLRLYLSLGKQFHHISLLIVVKLSPWHNPKSLIGITLRAPASIALPTSLTISELAPRRSSIHSLASISIEIDSDIGERYLTYDKDKDIQELGKNSSLSAPAIRFFQSFWFLCGTDYCNNQERNPSYPFCKCKFIVLRHQPDPSCSDTALVLYILSCPGSRFKVHGDAW